MALTVFVSHAWVDQSASRVQDNPRRGLAPVLRDTLARQGVTVFYDEQDVEELDDIEQRIRAGISAAALFVCWYSDAYRSRRACNWELAAALATDASRVVVVNPETGLDHVLPDSLRGSLVAAARDAADDADGWEDLAARIVERARARGGVFGDIATAETTPWFGDPPTRFSRFVGRAQPLWQLDSLLRPASVASGGGQPPPAVVVHGLGGVGKTALACEYATRLAGAYPGGIYWLRMGAVAPGTEPGEHVRLRLASQMVRIADQDPASRRAARRGGARGESPEAVARVVGRYLDQQPTPYLWVLDDLPAGLSASDFAACLPPGHRGRCLVTTQGTTYRHVPNLDLGVMPAEEAVELLLGSGSGSGRDGTEADTAGELVARLGYLPLALEVVGELVSLPGTTPQSLLAELADPAQPLDLVEEAASNPHGLSLGDRAHAERGHDVHAEHQPPRRGELLAAGHRQRPERRPAAAPGHPGSGAEHGRCAGPGIAPSPGHGAEPVPGPGSRRRHHRGARADRRHDPALPAGPRRLRRRLRMGGRTGHHSGLGDVEDIRTHQANQRIAAFGQALAQHQARPDDPGIGVVALRKIGRYLHVERRYREAADIERRAVSVASQALGPGRAQALVAQGDLGISLAHSGRAHEALALLQSCAATLQRCFGPDDIDTMTVKHNVASWLQPVDADAARQLRPGGVQQQAAGPRA